MNIYLQLFISFVQIGALSFGGGYAAMPLIQQQVVTLHGWLSPAEFTDLITISQMTPGPISVNSATFVGIRTAGLPGAIVATLGCVFPSCVIVMLLAFIYYHFKGLSLVQGVLSGLRPAVVAMIASAGISLLILALYGQRELPASLGGMDWIAAGLFVASLIVLRRFKLSPICIMAGSGAIGALLYALI